jgi:hypothetical protein
MAQNDAPMSNAMSWPTSPWHKLALPMKRLGDTPVLLIVVLLYSLVGAPDGTTGRHAYTF